MLLTFLRSQAQDCDVKAEPKHESRPDMVAALRGGNTDQGMDGEGDPKTASMQQALFWSQIYREVLAMEEKVLERIQQLMARQSPEARREVELTNVPVVAAQAARFRSRLGFWVARVHELE